MFVLLLKVAEAQAQYERSIFDLFLLVYGYVVLWPYDVASCAAQRIGLGSSIFATVVCLLSFTGLLDGVLIWLGRRRREER
jgi:hypothetical protein